MVSKSIIFNDLIQVLVACASYAVSLQGFDDLTHRSRGICGMVEMEGRLLSVIELGKYIRVINDTMYKWIDKGGTPADRMGRLWKFKKYEVDEWVKAGGAADIAGSDKSE